MVFRIQIGYHKYYKGKQVHNLFSYLEPNRYNTLYWREEGPYNQMKPDGITFLKSLVCWAFTNKNDAKIKIKSKVLKLI
jgi:hypothetical protein